MEVDVGEDVGAGVIATVGEDVGADVTVAVGEDIGAGVITIVGLEVGFAVSGLMQISFLKTSVLPPSPMQPGTSSNPVR